MLELWLSQRRLYQQAWLRAFLVERTSGPESCQLTLHTSHEFLR